MRAAGPVLRPRHANENCCFFRHLTPKSLSPISPTMKRKSTSQSAFLNLRVLLASVFCLAGVFMALLSFGAFSNASAQSNAAQAQAQESEAQQVGQTTVIPALHSDLSRPLREQPLIWPPAQAEHEANLNPKIPHQHQPFPVLFSLGMAFFTRESVAIAHRPIPTVKWERLSMCRW